MTSGVRKAPFVRLLVVAIAIPAALHPQPVKFSSLKVSSTRELSRQAAWIITQGDQWKRFLTEILGHTGTPPRIDFQRHSVVAILAGQKSSAGYSIQVQKVTDDPQPGQPSRGTVHYRIVGPPPDAMTAQVLTYPFVLIRIEKKFTSLEFDPPIRVDTFSDPRP
ncbi:MAG: protease complex subunit PrcB family protein [Bryobacteraceae bacterium]